MTILEVDSLKMYYEVRGKKWVKAVDNVSLKLEMGHSLGLAGESGCGKTSLALSIMRLLPSNGKVLDGRIMLKNENIFGLDDETFRKKVRWKIISMVPQAAMNALNPVVRVGDQIAEAIMLHENVGKSEAKNRVKELFRLVGLNESRVDDYPHEFSGGMKQRAMIAMALACNPEIVIADEPTTALDVIVQARILELLKDLREKLDLSLLLITHDLSIISEICDVIAIMYAGKIVEWGLVTDIYEKPVHPYTRGLLASVPSVKGKRRKLDSIPGAPPDLLNPPLGCRFHPRCPYAREICMKEDPPLAEVMENRYVACHRLGGKS